MSLFAILKRIMLSFSNTFIPSFSFCFRSCGILLLHSSLKTRDVGLATQLTTEHTHSETAKGTYPYFSPEVFEETEQRNISYPSDLWAAGCILYELCYLTFAFGEKNPPSLMRHILMGEPSYQDVVIPTNCFASSCYSLYPYLSIYLYICLSLSPSLTLSLTLTFSDSVCKSHSFSIYLPSLSTFFASLSPSLPSTSLLSLSHQHSIRLVSLRLSTLSSSEIRQSVSHSMDSSTTPMHKQPPAVLAWCSLHPTTHPSLHSLRSSFRDRLPLRGPCIFLCLSHLLRSQHLLPCLPILLLPPHRLHH